MQKEFMNLDIKIWASRAIFTWSQPQI